MNYDLFYDISYLISVLIAYGLFFVLFPFIIYKFICGVIKCYFRCKTKFEDRNKEQLRSWNSCPLDVTVPSDTFLKKSVISIDNIYFNYYILIMDIMFRYLLFIFVGCFIAYFFIILFYDIKNNIKRKFLDFFRGKRL